jgi:hypothetical protein
MTKGTKGIALVVPFGFAADSSLRPGNKRLAERNRLAEVGRAISTSGEAWNAMAAPGGAAIDR